MRKPKSRDELNLTFYVFDSSKVQYFEIRYCEEAYCPMTPLVTLHLNQIKTDHSTCITGARAKARVIMKASMLLYVVGMIILTTYGNN